MRSPKPNSRVDQAFDFARDANDMAKAAVLRTQAQGFVIGALIGVLRDTATIPQEAVRNIFVGAAAVIDAVQPQDADERETLKASRAFVQEMAGHFRIEIPPKGQAVMPRRN